MVRIFSCRDGIHIHSPLSGSKSVMRYEEQLTEEIIARRDSSKNKPRGDLQGKRTVDSLFFRVRMHINERGGQGKWYLPGAPGLCSKPL